MTAAEFRAIVRAVGQRAASGAPDADVMRAFRPALWLLWLTGMLAEEMRWACWEGYLPDSRRLQVFFKEERRSIELSHQANGFVRWLHRRRRFGQRYLCPAPGGREWPLAGIGDIHDFQEEFCMTPACALPSSHCPRVEPAPSHALGAGLSSSAAGVLAGGDG